MAGSYTVRDVCTALKIPCDAYDLKDGFNVLTDTLPAKKYDLIFIHPPYMNIIRYSENTTDLSNATSIQDFMQKMSSIVLRLSEYLSENGHLVVLLGNVRRNGRCYPLPAYLETIFHKELREELIKIQHNVNSDGIEYEWSKGDLRTDYAREGTSLRRVQSNNLEPACAKSTGRIRGTAAVKEIYRKLSSHPKVLTNPTFKATIRRTLQENAEQVSLGVWTNEGD